MFRINIPVDQGVELEADMDTKQRRTSIPPPISSMDEFTQCPCGGRHIDRSKSCSSDSEEATAKGSGVVLPSYATRHYYQERRL
jgi:hypothetical protein